MSDTLVGVKDGDLIDCCPVFVSKRPTTLDGDKVVLVTLELNGGRCHLILGPGHQGVTRGWRVGNRRYLRAVLVGRPNERRFVKKECPACDSRLQARPVLELDWLAEPVRRVATEMVEPLVLVPTSSTTVEMDCHLESAWQVVEQSSIDDGFDRATCPQCERTFDSL